MLLPGATVMVTTGSWGTAVWVGRGVREGATGEMGVVNWSSKAVLVGEGTDARVAVERGMPVGGNDSGVSVKEGGVEVRGCKRYEPVMAMAVRVRLALCTAASLAGLSEAFQNRNIKTINRPVIPSACK